MCGIVGYVGLHGQQVQPELIERMLQWIHHRGPDDKGVWCQTSVGLGTARLAIIDLVTGHQPLSNEDQTVWVAFNGEIYNFLELREYLVQQGHVFRTHSDTEVIVHAYEEWGLECVSHLYGMFGIALVDLPAKRLYLARDIAGEKPLFYTQQTGFFAFASELKPLLHELPLSRTLNATAIQSYMVFSRPVRDLCVFQEIQKLLPGQILQCHLEDGRIEISDYWTPPEQKQAVSLEEAEHTLLSLFEDAVRRFIIADVPVGAFLSGGTDSSAVVAMMRRFFDHPVKTFTAIYDDPYISEEHEAKQVARLLETDHHEIHIRPADVFRELPRLIWHLEEPFADASFIPTYFVSQKAREQVTVALTGDGGDELFGGYDSYFAWNILEHYTQIPQVVQNLSEGIINRIPIQKFTRYPGIYHYISGVKRVVQASKVTDDISRFHLLTGDGNLSALLPDATIEQLLALRRQTIGSYHGENSLDRLLLFQFRGLLPELYFTKVDRMSMANSLECRSPLVYNDIRQFALTLPTLLKVRGRQRKLLLKRVFEKFLPKEILYRPKKGFSIPFYRWLREDPQLRKLVEYYTLAEGRQYLQEAGGIKIEPITKDTQDYLARKHNRWGLPWKAVCFGLWWQTYVEHDGRSPFPIDEQGIRAS